VIHQLFNVMSRISNCTSGCSTSNYLCSVIPGNGFITLKCYINNGLVKSEMNPSSTKRKIVMQTRAQKLVRMGVYRPHLPPLVSQFLFLRPNPSNKQSSNQCNYCNKKKCIAEFVGERIIGS